MLNSHYLDMGKHIMKNTLKSGLTVVVGEEENYAHSAVKETKIFFRNRIVKGVSGGCGDLIRSP